MTLCVWGSTAARIFWTSWRAAPAATASSRRIMISSDMRAFMTETSDAISASSAIGSSGKRRSRRAAQSSRLSMTTASAWPASWAMALPMKIGSSKVWNDVPA